MSLQLDTQSHVQEWVKGELLPAGACCVKKKLHSIFTIKRIIVPSAYGLLHGGRSSRQLVGGSRYPAAPLLMEYGIVRRLGFDIQMAGFKVKGLEFRV